MAFKEVNRLCAKTGIKPDEDVISRLCLYDPPSPIMSPWNRGLSERLAVVAALV